MGTIDFNKNSPHISKVPAIIIPYKSPNCGRNTNSSTTAASDKV